MQAGGVFNVLVNQCIMFMVHVKYLRSCVKVVIFHDFQTHGARNFLTVIGLDEVFDLL